MTHIVVAYDKNRAIGRDGELPWAGKLPHDMARFKELTKGASVIMGRKTYESLPEQARPLPGRENIVLTLSQKAITGAVVARSLDEALKHASRTPIIIGGESIFAQALPLTDTIFATEIDTVVTGADTYFPEINPSDWEQHDREFYPADNKNAFVHSFVTYERRRHV